MRKISSGPTSSSSRKGFLEDGSSQRNLADGEKNRLIRVVNSKIKLLAILKRHGIEPERGAGNWSQSITCPFPFHKQGNESTASLGYNFSSDAFNCFGCGASGRAVEFIAFSSGVAKAVIAERLYLEVSGYDSNEEIEDDQNPKIEKALFEFAAFIQTRMDQYKSDPEMLHQIEKIMWWFDIYLLSKSPHNKIFVEELEARITKATELLEDF